jgi:hypothetical protein
MASQLGIMATGMTTLDQVFTCVVVSNKPPINNPNNTMNSAPSDSAARVSGHPPDGVAWDGRDGAYIYTLVAMADNGLATATPRVRWGRHWVEASRR